MEGDLDGFDFVLAERLGRTLEELGRMSTREHAAWRAWFRYRAAMDDFAAQRSGNG